MAPAPETDDQTLTFSELIAVLRKHWWLIASLAVLGATAAAFYSHRQTPIYRATTTIQIDPSPPRPLGHEVQSAVDVGTTVYGNTQYYETQYEVLQSRSLALQTVRRLGLHRDPTFVPNVPVDTLLDEEASAAEVTDTGVAIALQRRLTVKPVPDSRLVILTFDDADTERAKRVLRTLVELYIDNNIDSALTSTSVAAEWLDEQLRKLKEELTESELALHTYKREQQILSVSLDDQSNILRGEMSQLSSSLTQVRSELESLRARQQQLGTVDLSDPTTLPSREFLTSPILTTLRASYVSANQQLEEFLGTGKGRRHPQVVAAAANRDVHRQALLTELKNIRDALDRDIKAKEAEEAGLSKLLQRSKGQAIELNRLALEYRRLERAKENTEKIYSLVLERSKESDLTRHMRFNNIRLVDPAFTPTVPVRPHHPLNVGAGGMGGFLLGLGISFWRYWRDRTFKSAVDVQEQLDLPLLGLLPLTGPHRRALRKRYNRRNARGAGCELIVHDEPTSPAAEAARALRTNLMFSSPDRPQKFLVVTSGVPFEGKTTVACWIATAIAQAGKRVLLVDCDLRRPRIHRVFGRSNDVGVSTFVVEPELLNYDDLLTTVPNLSVIPAGPPVPNPAELLQSERFEALLGRLGEQYDTIVVDTPPVNAVTDAAVLSIKADGTILVVRAHSTPYDSAKHSVSAIRDVSNNLLGVVLNAFDQKHGGYNYGYGTYQYHHYYGSLERPRAQG